MMTSPTSSTRSISFQSKSTLRRNNLRRAWALLRGRRRSPPAPQTSQLPTGPIRRVEELIGLFGIHKSQARRVPLQLRAGHPDRNHAQQSDLCKRPAVGSKIGAGLGAVADRLQPVPMVFLDSRNGLLRTFVFIHFFLGNDSHTARPVRTVDDGALVAQHHRAGLDILVVFLHVLRARNSFRAAVPMQRDRTALAFGGKLVGDNFALGKGVPLRLRVVILHRGLDRRWGSEVQRPKDRVNHMTGPVPHRAVAERHPPAPTGRQISGMVGPVLRRTQPQVPVERWGNRMLLLEPRQRVDAGVYRGASRVDRVDAADGPVPNPLAEQADSLVGVALVPQWRYALLFLRA